MHDQASRITGSFKAIGRIIAHSALHGGPSIHGISPAIVHYICNSAEELEDNPPPLSLNDIPDLELRKCVSEVRIIPPNQDRRFLVQGLMLHNVINKRHLEIEDICKGIYTTICHLK